MTPTSSSSPMPVWVRAIRVEAEGIRSFELWPSVGELAEAEAGAHIDVHLPGGVIRQYSLTNPGESHRYIIGVNRDLKSRGGSRYLHEQIRVGDELAIGVPRNHFRLNETAQHSVLVAGGIGVTPLYAMARRLTELGRPWTFYYCARSHERAAFLPELSSLAASATQGILHPIFDGEPGQMPLDVRSVAQRYRDADLYCCGPTPLIDAFREACAGLPQERVHVEFFGSGSASTATDEAVPPRKAFQIVLQQSRKTLDVPPEKSVLDVLLANGLPVFSSCREGVCGSCETRVLGGAPEHHDRVLSPEERASGTIMMVCVSRCKGEKLVLDL